MSQNPAVEPLRDQLLITKLALNIFHLEPFSHMYTFPAGVEALITIHVYQCEIRTILQHSNSFCFV